MRGCSMLLGSGTTGRGRVYIVPVTRRDKRFSGLRDAFRRQRTCMEVTRSGNEVRVKNRPDFDKKSHKTDLLIGTYPEFRPYHQRSLRTESGSQ